MSSSYKNNFSLLRNLGLITVIFLLTKCEKSENYEPPFNGEAPEGLFHWNISKVEGSNTGLVNQVINLDVWYPTSSGCDYVSEFVSDNNLGKTIRIKAYGATIDGSCTMVALPKVIKYEFTPLEKGKYVLKFINKNETEIIHYLTIK